MIISLENLLFVARHGLFEHENLTGNDFRVDLSVTYPSPALETNTDEIEKIENSVSYADLFEIVKEEMQTTRLLLETVAHEIVKKIKEKYPDVLSISCKITKISPPIPNMNGSASVTYLWPE